ncbi:hypothetical protein SO802_006005 [Lithocarpus litseifolius]|uniref:DUF4283 domain-containing protein n=1 Tax=Lithocarpus litseifolius TaxID=425828 RepID=A0AAW2DJP5_9ROSI
MRKAWGMNSELQIVEVGSNLFQFKFQTEFDLSRVLKGGLWSFDNQLLLLKRWHKGMTASNVKLEHASLWVQIWGAPFVMVSPQVAKEIGSRLRTVEDAERRRGQDTLKYFMRVRVALPVSKRLRCGGFIADSDGKRIWAKFKYERLPIFCYFCGILGDDLRHCASHYVVERYRGEVDYQYVENHGEEAEIQEVETKNDGLDRLNHADNSEMHGTNSNIQQRDNIGDRGVVDVENNYAITNIMDNDDKGSKSHSDSFKENNVN